MKIEAINKQNLEVCTELILKLWPDCEFEEEYRNCLRILDSAREEIFLSTDQSIYLGFIYLSLRTDYVEGTNSSPVAYIEGIYVEPQSRMQGIAASLVERGAQWGIEKGCSDPNRNNTLVCPTSTATDLLCIQFSATSDGRVPRVYSVVLSILRFCFHLRYGLVD